MGLERVGAIADLGKSLENVTRESWPGSHLMRARWVVVLTLM